MTHHGNVTKINGAEVEPENIGNVIAQLHFCNLRAARAFRDIVTKMVNDWEADHAEREGEGK